MKYPMQPPGSQFRLPFDFLFVRKESNLILKKKAHAPELFPGQRAFLLFRTRAK